MPVTPERFEVEHDPGGFWTGSLAGIERHGFTNAGLLCSCRIERGVVNVPAEDKIRLMGLNSFHAQLISRGLGASPGDRCVRWRVVMQPDPREFRFCGIGFQKFYGHLPG